MINIDTKGFGEAAVELNRCFGGYLARDVSPRIRDSVDRSDLNISLHGMFLRTLSSLNSAWRLSHPSGLQLVASAARSILESLVDLILLDSGEPDCQVDRMLEWERSAKLLSAEAAMRFYREVEEEPPPEFAPMEMYVQQNASDVREKRKQLWPRLNGKHPSRWTGRNLEQDCIRADADLEGLKRVYATDYRRLNWYVHGSALPGVRGLNVQGLEIVYANAQILVFELAFKCAEAALDIFTLRDSQIHQLDEFKSRKETLVLAALS